MDCIPLKSEGGDRLDGVIEIEQDLDNDRYISYQDFCDFLKTMPDYSKPQCFYLLLGVTGFRPIEVCRLTLAQLDFTNPSNPIIVNRITKAKIKRYYDSQGRVLAVKHIKIKRRVIPLWVKDYVEEYIRRSYNTFKQSPDHSFYLFSSTNSSKTYISTSGWEVDISKRRKKLYNSHPKWSWVYDVAFEKIVMGRKIPVYKFSLYSFRKARATWFGMQLMKSGINDVLLCVSQFMGHSRLETTYRYLKTLIAERNNGVNILAPPNLNERII